MPGSVPNAWVLLLFSHQVASNSLWPHEMLHARLPCPSPTARVCSSSCPLNGWCHPAQCLNAWSHLILNKLQWAGPLLSQFSKWGNDIRQRLCPLPRATQPRNRYEFSGSFGTPLLFCLPYDFLIKSQWQSQSRNEIRLIRWSWEKLLWRGHLV